MVYTLPSTRMVALRGRQAPWLGPAGVELDLGGVVRARLRLEALVAVRVVAEHADEHRLREAAHEGAVVAHGLVVAVARHADAVLGARPGPAAADRAADLYGWVLFRTGRRSGASGNNQHYAGTSLFCDECCLIPFSVG